MTHATKATSEACHSANAKMLRLDFQLPPHLTRRVSWVRRGWDT